MGALAFLFAVVIIDILSFFFKDNKACIGEHREKLADAANRFTEIINTYFEMSSKEVFEYDY